MLAAGLNSRQRSGTTSGQRDPICVRASVENTVRTYSTSQRDSMFIFYRATEAGRGPATVNTEGGIICAFMNSGNMLTPATRCRNGRHQKLCACGWQRWRINGPDWPKSARDCCGPTQTTADRARRHQRQMAFGCHWNSSNFEFSNCEENRPGVSHRADSISSM